MEETQFQESLLSRALDHNKWATAELIVFCQDLPEGDHHRIFDIGLGSVQGTLLHIISAMYGWADRIVDRPRRTKLSSDEGHHNSTEMLKLVTDADEQLRQSIAALIAEGRIEEMMEFAIPELPEPFRFTRGTAIVHVISHGMHHRAQVLYMLKQLGHTDLPDLDAVSWELERD